MPIGFLLSSDVESEPQPERTRNRGRDDDGATFEEHLDRLRGRHPRRSDRNSEVVLRGHQPQVNRTSTSRALYDRRHPASRSTEEKKESGHEPPVGGYQLVLSPQNAKDCTVHFEMDIEDDLEVQLEEFSRLKRLGRFGAAREMFQRELAERTAYSLPVLIEHADMLYGQGDYRGFSDLVLGYRRRLAKRDFNVIEQLLFELNEALAETLLGEDPEIRHRSYLGEARALFNVESNVDSIEVQILNRLLRIWALREGEQRKRRNIRHVVKSTYRPVSKALIAQERFWELKDLIAEIANVSIDDAWLRMFASAYGDDSSLQEMIDDFTPGPYDESSYLALLDVLVALSGFPFSKQSFTDPDSLSATGHILQWARQVVSAIETKSPDLVKSRPYIRWILAEAEHSRRLEGDVIRQHFSRFPGVTVYRSLVPIYIPRACENPGWPEVHACPQYTRLVQIALRTARAMGDFQSEVLCLQELICRSSHPRELFEQLKQRQRQIEGNSIAYRQTCLSMYLLQDMGSSHSLEALLNEYHLINSPTQSLTRRNQDGFTQWCYIMLQRAFAIYAGKDKEELEDEASRLSRKLPYDVASLVNGTAIFRRPLRVSIPSSSDSGSDDDSDDDGDHEKEAEKSFPSRTFRRTKVRREPLKPEVDPRESRNSDLLPSKFQPLTDVKDIHDSNKVIGVDQMVQTENSGGKHNATPHIAIDQPSTEANADAGPVQDKQPHEVEEPFEDNPPKQAHVHEPSSCSE